MLYENRMVLPKLSLAILTHCAVEQGGLKSTLDSPQACVPKKFQCAGTVRACLSTLGPSIRIPLGPRYFPVTFGGLSGL
jgi:hypothetical protein